MDMRMIQKIVAGCIGLCLFACTETDELKTTAGKTGFVVSLIDGSVGVESRKTPAELNVPKTEFTIKVWKAGSDELVASAPCTGETGQVIEVGTGVYDVTAEAGENPLIALDAPYYKGITEDQRVDADKTTNVSIACKVANSLVSVKYDEENLKFSDIYQDGYYVRVVAGGDSEDIKNVENSVYFRAGSAFEVYFCGMKIGETEEKQVKLDVGRTTLQAGDHLILTLSPEPDKYDLPLSITKVEVKQETINATIPMEWLPKPKVEAEGFTNNTLSMYETETPTAKFNFNLSAALQELKFTLNFADETYQSLNKAYTLSELSEEDRTALTEAGVVLPAIGLKEASLDFTNLVAKFTGSTTGEALSNVIILDEVKANNRTLEGNQTYTIQTSAPDFNLVVYPGNTWTKQFTANTEITHGNADVIRKGMTFEYRLADSEEWISSPDSIIDGLPQDKEKETAYQVRGIFGKHYTEVVNAKTYPAIPLENGGLEGGYVSYGEDKNSSEYGAVYIWDNWSTLNELTCDKCTIIFWTWGNTAFNSRSGTRPASPREGSLGSQSAWIMTMGYGYGGWSGPQIITPSELFLGTLTNVNHDDDTATKNYGLGHKSRPTGLKFYYKYAPYNGDKSDIYIQMKGVNGEILGSASLNETNTVSSFIETTLNIEYEAQYKELEPETIVVVFKSGVNADVKDYGTGDKTGINSAEPSHRGSELYIDDVELVYSK